MAVEGGAKSDRHNGSKWGHFRLSQPSAHEAIARLHAAGVIRPLTSRRRGQVWGAGLVLAELDDLNTRIAVDARPAALGVPGPGPAPDRTDG